MTTIRFPDGMNLEQLTKGHRRKGFTSGQPVVDDWLLSKALQNQEKRLSITKLLVNKDRDIAGYFTLATGQVDFGDLPPDIAKRLPRRMLPVALLAWFAIATSFQGTGLGRLLLAQALSDCHAAGQTFAFIAVMLDCIDEQAKNFYERFDFKALPGHPFRLYLSFAQLDAMMKP